MTTAQALKTVHDRYWPSWAEPIVADAARRCLLSLAQAPLHYKGMGAYGVVFCDARGIGYKAARDPAESFYRSSFEREAEWLRVASTIPEIKRHVAGFRYFHRDLLVIERECILGDSIRRSGRYTKDTRSDLHRTIGKVMLRNGFTMPEFKEDSYVWQTGRGWVLVDASSPLLTGHRLIAHAVQVIAGKRFFDESPNDVGYALRMESGRTVDKLQADRLDARLASLPDAEDRRHR